MTRIAALAIVLSLAGCGGGGTLPLLADLLRDTKLESARGNAAQAFAQGNFDQAAQLYRIALDLAQARDDARAIGDVGYDLAVTELRRGENAASLRMATATRVELQRRAAPVFPELRLVEAAALYRLGQAEAAEPIAREVAVGIDAAALRGRFLLGLIAADRRDGGALAAALATLGMDETPEWRADRFELEGRAASLEGDLAAARAAFLTAAELRREILDYPSMARVLAAAGETAERAGTTVEAADLYLRAGRSALRGSSGDARAETWLAVAERLARSAGDQPILEAIADLRSR